MSDELDELEELEDDDHDELDQELARLEIQLAKAQMCVDRLKKLLEEL